MSRAKNEQEVHPRSSRFWFFPDLCLHVSRLPSAYALGCILSALRGWGCGGADGIGRSRQKSPFLAQRTREKWGTRLLLHISFFRLAQRTRERWGIRV